jgi:uncharacterized protein (DUF885 family)
MTLSNQPDVEFDLRAYHDLVFKNGALPMNLLEENVRAWIASRKTL